MSRRLLALRLLAVAILATACGGQATPTTSTLAASLPSGIYVDGAQGTPHYFIAVTLKTDTTFSGTVSFLAPGRPDIRCLHLHRHYSVRGRHAGDLGWDDHHGHLLAQRD